jgi:dTDP-4-amino-4,6-dideoxygalactose transaminase
MEVHKELGRGMCEKVGVGHATALASGIAALHLALVMLGIERGEEVLCSDLNSGPLPVPAGEGSCSPL